MFGFIMSLFRHDHSLTNEINEQIKEENGMFDCPACYEGYDAICGLCGTKGKVDLRTANEYHYQRCISTIGKSTKKESASFTPSWEKEDD